MKNISYIIATIGFIVGSVFNINNMEASQEIGFYENFSFQVISDEGAACHNMFMSSDKCNETPTNCGEGGTGHGLTCSILCDSGSRIDCGSAEDSDPGEHASLISKTCFDNS